jgi:hypothetical protein
MFLILIAIQFALILYVDQTPENTSIWTFITTPSLWGSQSFVLDLLGLAAGLGLVGVVAAGTFGFKTDTLIFATAIAGFVSMGVVFRNLAVALLDDLTSRICGETASVGTCSPVNLFVGILIGSMAFYYIWTILEWWRGKDY